MVCTSSLCSTEDGVFIERVDHRLYNLIDKLANRGEYI